MIEKFRPGERFLLALSLAFIVPIAGYAAPAFTDPAGYRELGNRLSSLVQNLDLATWIIIFKLLIYTFCVAILVLIFTRLFFYRFNKLPEENNIKEILSNYEGGIYKRIDENRELLLLIQTEAPHLLKENIGLMRWIRSNDSFLIALEQAVSIAPDKMKRFRPMVDFPRPFPQNELNNMGDNFRA